MNKQNLLILCGLAILLCSMLACITTVEPFVTYPPDDTPDAPTARTPVPAGFLSETPEPDSGAVFEVTIRPRCATVTAIEALHLRAGPSEKTEVLEYLQHGEVVIIIHSHGEWWKIETPTARGYSKADFLKESQCDE